MSDCGCEKAKSELEEFLHQELSRDEYSDIAEHLANCTDCSDEAHVGRVLTDAVKRACQDGAAPEALRLQVVTRLRVSIDH